jgi:acyl-CoA hydrolase
MENHKLVLPEHLNHYGYLFGGNLLKWSDEYAWICASLDYPGCNFVTIGMEQTRFLKSVKEGAILRFAVERADTGTTSAQYSVNAFADNIERGTEEPVFSTIMTFVCLDDKGEKSALP